jgi:hypothetical protein
VQVTGTARIPVSPTFSVTTNSNSARLGRAISRYAGIIAKNQEGGSTEIAALDIQVASTDESLNSKTDYSYTLSLSATAAGAVKVAGTASSIYGAMYAMVSWPFAGAS